MNKIARKLVLSIVSVVLAVFALGTTTFAWFTLTNTAVVQPFEAQIVADSGIEIAIGNIVTTPADLNWVTTLTTAEVEGYIASAYGANFRFNHVTTTDGTNYFTLGTDALIGTSSGYLELPIHFRSDTANQILWTAVTLTSTTANWTADVQYTHVNGVLVNSGTEIAIDASDAMRISVAGQVSAAANIVAFEKAAAGNNIVLGTGGDLSNGGVGNNGAMNYYYAKTASLPGGAGAAAAVSTISTITAINYDEADPLTYIPVSDLGDGTVAGADATYYGTITIRIWVEGWDANSFNNVLDRVIAASFQFTGNTI